MVFAGLLVAVLIATSALAKIRMDRRTGMGTSPATLLELAVAAVVGAAPAMAGTLPVSLVVFGFGVSVTASVAQLRRYGRERLRREESEGGRLAAYVRYLSAAEEAGADDEAPPGGGSAPDESMP